MADGTMDPIMNIAATDPSEFRVDNDIVGRFQLRYWTVFELDTPSLLEDKGQILRFLLASVKSQDKDLGGFVDPAQWPQQHTSAPIFNNFQGCSDLLEDAVYWDE